MADGIEVQLGTRNLIEVKISDEDRFPLVVRTGEHLPERSNDATATPREHLLRVITERGVEIKGVVPPAGELVAGEDEAASLAGDMAHSGQPAVAAVGGWRAIELDPLAVHCRAQQRHVVLPADYGSQVADLGREDRQRRAITVPPDEALARGRH